MKKQLAVAGVLCVLALSGCVIFDSTTHIISIVGEINATDDGFRLDGEVINSGQGDPQEYQNVTVSLYTGDGTLIESTNAGSLVRRTNVSMQTETIPQYVIIHSPDFWDAQNIEIDYYVLTENNYYDGETVTSKDELPVQPP